MLASDDHGVSLPAIVGVRCTLPGPLESQASDGCPVRLAGLTGGLDLVEVVVAPPLRTRVFSDA